MTGRRSADAADHRIAVERGLALGADGYEVSASYDVFRKAGCEVNPRLKRGGSGDQRARDRVVGIRGGGLHPAYPGRQLQNRRPERPAAEPAAGRVVRIVGNRGAALQQPQTIIENRALTCVENVVRLELVIVSCSVMVRQSIWPLESAAVVSAKPVLLLLGLTPLVIRASGAGELGRMRLQVCL